MSEERILFIRGGAVGDFVLTLPLLATLRRTYPDASMEVLGTDSLLPCHNRTARFLIARQLRQRLRGAERERGNDHQLIGSQIARPVIHGRNVDE